MGAARIPLTGVAVQKLVPTVFNPAHGVAVEAVEFAGLRTLTHGGIFRRLCCLLRGPLSSEALALLRCALTLLSPKLVPLRIRTCALDVEHFKRRSEIRPPAVLGNSTADCTGDQDAKHHSRDDLPGRHSYPKRDAKGLPRAVLVASLRAASSRPDCRAHPSTHAQRQRAARSCVALGTDVADLTQP